MTAPIYLQLPHLESTNTESASDLSNCSFLQKLGAELVFTQNASGQYLSFYWQAASSYSLTEAQVVGRLLNQIFCPVALNTYLEQIRRVVESCIPERGSYSFALGCEYFPFDLVISPILPVEGNVSAVLVMGRRSPQATDSGFPSTSNINQLLSQITENIRKTLDISTIWQQTAMGLGQGLDVSSCIIYSYRPDCVNVEVTAEYCQPNLPSMLGEQIELADASELSKAISTLEPIVVYSHQNQKMQPQSVLIVATCYKNQPNGLISLQQYDRARQWSAAEVELVEKLAEQVGTAIAHATLYKELELAREQAEQASRLKSEFLANTSHELRTPLNGMLGFLKLVIDGVIEEHDEQMEFIEDAYNCARHLHSIINDILDIARIEAGKMDFELGPIKLNDLFSDLEGFTQTQAQQKNLSFCIEMPPTHDEIIIYGNYRRLLQVLLNLVGNAIKFTHEGGITISAEVIKKKTIFAGREFPGIVKIGVADTGIGVSLDKQDKLFQSFSQVDGSRTRPYGGTGLGLAISQRLVETMGGNVNFYSMGEGLGSTVTFTVPLHQVPVMISVNP